MRCDRTDAVQAQRHLQKDPELSPHPRAELHRRPAWAANRASEEAKVPARDQTGERRGVVRNSRASFVENDEQFHERVAQAFTRDTTATPSPRYIDGRELYVSLIGNVRLTVFPIRELVFREVPPDEPKIATYKAKSDEEYRKQWGLNNQFAQELEPELIRQIEEKCKQIYRLLTIDGYARIDLRLTSKNGIYFIEANPNPILAEDEDFALAAAKAGFSYPQLIDRIAGRG